MMEIDRKAGATFHARAIGAGWISAGLHLALAVLIGAIVSQTPVNDPDRSIQQLASPMQWIEQAGLPGGGRDGQRTRDPAPPAERPGQDRITIPSRRQTSLADPRTEEPSLQQIVIPVVPEASGLREVPGNLTAVSIVSPWGGGPGNERGAGPGDGPGLGPGRRGGVGDGPGGQGGLSSPELIRQVRPNYTSAALQARVQGIVVMEAVIRPDGSVGDVKIVRSLDRTFGLDDEALRAVKRWRFRPGHRGGVPIAMVVSIEMLFELR